MVINLYVRRRDVCVLLTYVSAVFIVRHASIFHEIVCVCIVCVCVY